MERLQLLFGLGLVALSVLAFYVALPRGGQVVRFLRNDEVQSYYTVVVIAAFVIGAISILAGVTEFDAMTGYK